MHTSSPPHTRHISSCSCNNNNNNNNNNATDPRPTSAHPPPTTHQDWLTVVSAVARASHSTSTTQTRLRTSSASTSHPRHQALQSTPSRRRCALYPATPRSRLPCAE